MGVIVSVAAAGGERLGKESLCGHSLGATLELCLVEAMLYLFAAHGEQSHDDLDSLSPWAANRPANPNVFRQQSVAAPYTKFSDWVGLLPFAAGQRSPARYAQRKAWWLMFRFFLFPPELRHDWAYLTEQEGWFHTDQNRWFRLISKGRRNSSFTDRYLTTRRGA